MNNIQITASTPNISALQKPEAKSDSSTSSAGDFMRVAAENFKNLTLSQTLVVPQNHQETATGFWASKQDIAKKETTFEEYMADHVDELMKAIEAVLKEKKNNR